MALNEFNRSDYLAEIGAASIYLQSIQLVTGGWENFVGSGEYNEFTGEALWGIVAAVGRSVIPDVVDQNETDANSAITAAGFIVGTITYEYSDTTTAGLVISQDPVGGTEAYIGSSVDLVISSGQPVVPYVVDMTEAEANSTITAAGLIVGTVTYDYNDTLPAWTVMSQSPVSGTTVATGSSVDLVVSLGQAVVVPDVVNQTEAVASSDITGAGLISQDPLGGATVPIGSYVDIVVSSGQPVVPYVVGETEPNATAEIVAVDNLTVGTVSYQYSDTVVAGLVISQNPVGNTSVPIGSSVDLVVSGANVPDVVGQTEAYANTAITAASLTVGIITYDYNDTVTAGNVISQNPTSGATVPIGLSIDLVVSGANVPDVENLSTWSYQVLMCRT
jgi:beta-lactam-binding protein with PASTA domain